MIKVRRLCIEKSANISYMYLQYALIQQTSQRRRLLALTFWPNIYYDVIFALLTERLARRQGGLDAGRCLPLLSVIDRFF